MAEWILTSSLLIVIVLAVRALFRGRMGLRLRYALWLLVLLRLLVPGTVFQTGLSVLNYVPLSQTAAVQAQPSQSGGSPSAPEAEPMPVRPEGEAEPRPSGPAAAPDSAPAGAADWRGVLTAVWLGGAGGLAAFLRVVDSAVESGAVQSGGTPVLLGERLLEILSAVRRHFVVQPESEITLEANPAAMTFAQLQALREGGFNRISMGVQSASDRELQTLGRRHSFAQAQESVQMAQAAGFRVVGVYDASAAADEALIRREADAYVRCLADFQLP